MSPLRTVVELPGAALRGEMYRLLAALLVIKCAGLLIDPHLRFFMGDSASYLHAALTTWSPPDRSVSYPWLVEISAVRTASPFALVVLQSLLGVLSCLLVYGMLRLGAGVRPGWAAIASLALAVEPTQLFYERMVMAESAGLLLILAATASALAYVDSGRWRWAVVMAVFGLGAISMRMSLLPGVLGLTVAVPVLRTYTAHASQDRGRPVLAALRLGLHMCVIVGSSALLHQAYKHAYADIVPGEPAYMRAEGQMRIGLLAPLVKTEHLARYGVPETLLDTVGPPLQDRQAREAQIWKADGLWARLEQAYGREQAQILAKKIAARAFQSDPLAALEMSAHTVADYFDADLSEARLRDDAGVVSPPEDMLRDLREHLRYDYTGLHATATPVAAVFVSSRWWLTFVLFMTGPLALVCLWRAHVDPARRAAACVIGVTALGLVAGHMLFSHIVSFRYLHPLPAFFWMSLAIAFGAGGWLAPKHRSNTP